MTPEAASAFLASTAKSSGLEFTTEKLTAATAQLVASVERAPDGSFAYTPEGYATAYRMERGETVNVPVNEHVAGLIRQNATPIPAKVSHPTEPVAPSSPAPSSTPQWAVRGSGPVSDFAKALAAQEDAAIIRESETWPNPWLPNQTNRTRQQILVNRNPSLAARHRAQAGL